MKPLVKSMAGAIHGSYGGITETIQTPKIVLMTMIFFSPKPEIPCSTSQRSQGQSTRCYNGQMLEQHTWYTGLHTPTFLLIPKLFPLSPTVDLREPAPGPQATAGGPSEPVALNLNTASQEELQDLPGVGPVLAERIVAHRDGIGGFTAIEQLQEVPGIGPNKYHDLRDRVRVGAG